MTTPNRLQRLDDLIPPIGPCGICGGPDARHRTFDVMVERYRAGELIEDIAYDMDYLTLEVQTVIEEWQ